MRFWFIIQLLLITFLTFVGCSSEEPKTTLGETKSYSEVRTLISSDEAILEKPSNLIQIQNGRIFLLDYGLLEIIEVSPEGKIANNFSRRGKGPGELTKASNLVRSKEKIIVYNTDRASISRITADGDYIDTVPIDVNISMSAEMAVYKNKILMSAINMDEGIVAFASLNNLSGTAVSLGDTTIGKVSNNINFDEYQNDIDNRQIPDVFKDDVLTLFDEKGKVYIVYQTQTRVQKYNLSGRLLWDKKIPLPERQTIFNNFVKRNSGNQFRRVFPLKYFTDVNHFGNNLYLMVTMEEEQQSFILVLNDKTGEVRQRINFPNLKFAPSGFAYQPQNDAFFFINRQDASLLKVNP